MAEKIITKSFERLLDKGKHRGFITFDELGKSLGKRNGTNENIEKACLILVDEKTISPGVKIISPPYDSTSCFSSIVLG